LGIIEDALHICANDHPEIALIVDKRPVSSIDIKDNDITLWWGEKPAQVSFAYPIAQDEMVIILNRNNSNSNLSNNELLALYSGKVHNWDEISTFQHTVSVWSYQEGNELRGIFDENILGDQRLTPLAFLAPSSRAMLESVTSDPGAIGFLPRSWLNQDIFSTQIDMDLQKMLNKPVLALTYTKPQSGSLILLDCLQNGVGQTALLEHFSPPN
jgi:ABC-type phosphate transport system substrate-binding protein